MKRSGIFVLVVVIVAAVAGGTWLYRRGASSGGESANQSPYTFVYVPGDIQPLPVEVRLDERKVDLGHRLFVDPRLSSNNVMSCSTCHDLDNGGDDGRRFPLGFDGQPGEINSPTVFNAVFNFKQFWDGRAHGLEEQASGPLLSPEEMRSNWPDVIRKLSEDEQYLRDFRKLYGGPPTEESILDAIATFERSLITPNAPFDRYLLGDKSALTPKAKKGYELFQEFGCVNCHHGMNVGGTSFQTMGKMAAYFADRGDVRKADLGRYNVTGKERDRHKFKVPTLRNVALTAPYFHDGTATTLEEAVRVMAKYQLGYELEDEEIDAIVAFLGSLTGERPASLRR